MENTNKETEKIEPTPEESNTIIEGILNNITDFFPFRITKSSKYVIGLQKFYD